MRRFGLAILGVWFLTASCGDSTAPIGGGSETSAGTASSSSTADSGPAVDSTASPDGTTLGDGSADGTSAGPECTLADVSVCDDGDPCTVDDCFDGLCTHEAEADGTACTGRDGNGGTCQGGECVTACAADRECDDRNPCTTDSCDPTLGQCAFAELDGVDAPASEQTAADCQVVECQNGVAVSEDDNADTPDDANDCTTDECIAGTPTHDPYPASTACGVDGLCDGAGACVDCISPDDCDELPADDDCQTRTCVAGVCGQDFTPQGTAVNATLQTGGNCQLIVCDGAGDMESVDDDTDLPVDGLECTDDQCNSGIPLNPDVPDGTACSAGVCNATGDCVGCLTPADCGGTNTFCQTITCIGNICGVDNTVGGIPLPSLLQTPNDCQELQCDGNGQTQSVANDTDVPLDDGAQCTDEICSNGLPFHPDLPIDTSCDQDGGIVCDGAGSCVPCTQDSHCSNAGACQVDACINNQCAPQPGPVGQPCDDGLFCTTGDACDAAGQCTGAGNPCDGADGDGDCSETCNEATDSCSANDPAGSPCDDGAFCTGNDTCNGSGTCTAGSGSPCPGPDGDADCIESCNEATDSCTAPDPIGQPCDDGLFCTGGDTCGAGGVCQPGSDPCGPPVPGDADCSTACNEGSDACDLPDPVGSACTDGLFCNGTDTCDAAGTCGTHTGDPCPGPDGDTNCGESCNEAGDACNANDAVGSSCSDGLFCTGADFCDAAGACVSPGDPCPGPDGDGDCIESCSEAADSCTAPDPSQSACDDGLFCTLVDSCSAAGVCQGSGAACPGPDGDGDCSESCDEIADACSANDPAASSCQDGLFCNGADTCDGAGACDDHTGDPCAGPDGDGDCSESCDEGANNCNANDAAGSACTDGLFCTGAETCDAAGACVSPGDPCPGPDGDGNCAESCSEGGDNCLAPDPATSACDDGLFCTLVDACNAGGSCVGSGAACPGPDGDGDCSESCDEAANNCDANDAVGSLCNDGLFCTGGAAGDACNASGACVPGADPCPGSDGDGNCAETCNEGADNCLGNDPGGALCDDGLLCTTSSMCNGGGSCIGSGDPCAGNLGDADTDCSESCNPATGLCTANDPAGSACVDAFFCNGTDTCNGTGSCSGHTGNPCLPLNTTDGDCSGTCSESADNCNANDPVGTGCNDGNLCNGTDTCSAGNCSLHTNVNPCATHINDGDTDCSETCVPATGACTANDPAGATCTDNLFCNGTDTCNGANACSNHSGNPCLPLNTTNNDCSESCSETNDNCTANDPGGTGCNDGLFCTASSSCSGGVCVGSGTPCTQVGDNDCDCTESCDETLNNCTANDPDGSNCQGSFPGVCENAICIDLSCV